MENNKILANRYQLIKKIGGGGMAVVFLAHDNYLDRQVAIKLLRDEYVDDPEFIRQFQKEAKAIAKLSHQNIVNIYDFGQDGNITYLVMEYVEGQTLKDIIAQKGQLPVEQILDYGIQICHGMAQAHNQQIVHKDLKPHNIMIDKNGVVKVTDFGIAQAVNNLTITHNKGILGSAHYFSPEQAKGEHVDLESDIYSLGVVLYEMVTGKVPFTGENPVTVALKHIQEAPPSMEHLRNDLPQGLETIVLKAMHKNPLYRFQSMQEMADALIDLQISLSERGYFAKVNKALLDENLGMTRKNDIYHINQDESDVTRILNEDYLQEGNRKELLLNNESKKKEVKTSNNQMEHPKGHQKTKKISLVNLAISFVIVLGLFLGVVFGVQQLLSKDDVKVPSVRGETTLDAQKTLVSVGLSLNIEDKIYSDEYEIDQIISQDPKEGSKVKLGREINVVVSLGTDKTFVPELKGLTEREARVELENSELKLGESSRAVSEEYPAGQVVYQSLPEGEEVVKGTAVDIVISQGEPIQVPSLLGKTEAEAKTILTERKLMIGKTSQSESEQYYSGQIISQSPTENSKVTAGDTIDVVYSSGPGPLKEGQISLIIPQSGQITIQIVDMTGTNTVYEEYRQAGEYLSEAIHYAGPAEVTVSCDGTVIWSNQFE